MHDRNPIVPLAILAMLTLSALATSGCGTTPATAPSADRLPAGSRLGSSSPLTAAGLDPGDAPSTPGTVAPTTLDRLWPNDDGHFWRFRLNRVVTGFPGFHYYDSKDAVPPAPSPLELAEWLQRHRRVMPAGTGSASGTWTLRFEGRGSTLSGAAGQNLTETLIPDAGPRLSTASSKQAFLALLARARPDLAPALRRRFPEIEATSVDLYPPILLHGYIWEKTAEHIGTYGDLDLNLAWKFLEANVSPGHEFTFQLVPLLADDVFLHALVLPARFETHPRLVSGQVEVLYVIDFGVSAVTDESGQLLGLTRIYSYGTVTYVPAVGPVAGVEYNGAQAGGSPADLLFDMIRFGLVESGPGTLVSDVSDLVSARR